MNTAEEDLVNPFRLAKGDLMVVRNAKGKISHAIPAKLTIVKELIRAEVFPYHYEIYGMGFLELQNAFRGPTKAKCSSVLLEQWGIGASAGQAATMYIHVRKALGEGRANRIEMALNTPERRRSAVAVQWDRRNVERVEELKWCFEKLIESMDAEKKKLEELQKN